MIRFRRNRSEIAAQRPAAEVEMPAGSYFVLFGEMPDSYGGTMSATLLRAKIFALYGGVSVDLLTVGYRRDFGALEKKMWADGRLVPGMRLRSFWSEMSSISGQPTISVPQGHDVTPLTEADATEVFTVKGVLQRRELHDGSSTPARVDFVRPDGSLIVSQLRTSAPGAAAVKLSFMACDASNRPWAVYSSESAMWRAWLDRTIGTEPCFVFSDFFGLARVTHNFRRDNATVIHSFHNNHLRRAATTAPLDSSQPRFMAFMRNIDAFDATVFLTPRQRDDVDVLMGPSSQRYIVPNSCASTDSPGSGPMKRTLLSEPARNPALGVLPTRLVAGKRVDQVVEALCILRDRGLVEASLDVYGDGPEAMPLADLVASTGMDQQVRLRGFLAGAAQKFAEGSFLPFASETEGMPLTLIEAMSRGCVPISYDIRYGPRDIIRDGVDGFLVESGDVAGLADAIERFLLLGPEAQAVMRNAARERAAEFGPVEVTRRWAEVLRHAQAQRGRPDPFDLRVVDTMVDLSGPAGVMASTATVSRPLSSPSAFFVFVGRDAPSIVRVPCVVTELGDGSIGLRAAVEPERVNWMRCRFIDVFADIYDGGEHRSTRVVAASSVGDGLADAAAWSFVPYATQYGNLSWRRQASMQ